MDSGRASVLSAVVLAAGLSSRMGAFKPLLPLGGKPLLWHVIDGLRGSGAVGEIVVVTGHRAGEVEAAVRDGRLAEKRCLTEDTEERDGRAAETRAEKGVSAQKGVLDVSCVFNPDFAQGEMLSSVKAGLRRVMAGGHSAAGCVLAFADQPAVLPSTVRVLVEAFGEGCPPVVMPTHKGKRGHPLILSAAVFGEILGLGEAETLRTVVERHRARALQVPVEDAWVLEDLDTPEDLARVRARYEI